MSKKRIDYIKMHILLIRCHSAATRKFSTTFSIYCLVLRNVIHAAHVTSILVNVKKFSKNCQQVKMMRQNGDFEEAEGTRSPARNIQAQSQYILCKKKSSKESGKS